MDTVGGSPDIFVVKYDANGNVVWAKSDGEQWQDQAFGIAVDANGNSYVTGAFDGFFTIFGSDTLWGGGDSADECIFVAKYDANGNVVWAKGGGGSTGIAKSIGVDANGNSYVTGFFGSSTTFGSDTLINAGRDDIFVVKYDANGNVVWAKSAGGTLDDYGYAIAVDANGNSYVTGYFQSSAITFGSTTLTDNGNVDIFVVKYDASGNAMWAKIEGWAGSMYGFGIAVDANGNSYATSSSGVITFAKETSDSKTLKNVNTDGTIKIFVKKFDASGNVIWAKSSGGTSWAEGYGIAVDANGNSYVTGRYPDRTITFDATTLTNADQWRGSTDIFVSKLSVSYKITASAGANGSLSPSGNVAVLSSASQRFTFSPSTGYHLDSVIVDGVKSDSTTSYTFTNVSEDHTIRVTFAINTYVITSSAGANGTVSPTPNVTVNYGANRRFVFTPSTGYHADSVLVDNVKVDSATGYTFLDVQANHTIRVTFAINVYTIIAGCGPNGNITPSGSLKVNYGTQQAFTFVPDSGFQVDSVIVDGIQTDSITSYTFTNISMSHTIHAMFTLWHKSVRMVASWNLVSLPVDRSSYSKEAVFPTAISDAFAYQDGYHTEMVLRHGVGYWLKFDTAQTVVITGSPCPTDTFVLRSGWNLIGSISTTIPVTSVVTMASNLVISQFWKYNSGYTMADSIKPGYGYWVKSNEDGQIILGASPMLCLSNRIHIVPTTEMPPPAPGETVLPNEMPKEYALKQNYPNPFNPSTTLNYALPSDASVKIIIFNILGQEVARLADGDQTAGYKEVNWNAATVPSGVYFYRLDATSVSDPTKHFSKTRKMVLIR
jgi:hypothetical protein